jgi:hypothetical protein
MSSVHAFMTDEEVTLTWTYLFQEEGVVAFPDRSTTGNIPTYRSLAELADSSGVYQYYLASGRWGGYNPTVGQELAADTHPFRLMPHYGGPHLIWTVPRSWAKDGERWLVPGMLTDHPSYYVSLSGSEVVRRPESLALAFKRIKSRLGKGAVSSRAREGGFRGPLVSPGARIFHGQGGWLRVGRVHFDPEVKRRR